MKDENECVCDDGFEGADCTLSKCAELASAARRPARGNAVASRRPSDGEDAAQTRRRRGDDAAETRPCRGDDAAGATRRARRGADAATTRGRRRRAAVLRVDAAQVSLGSLVLDASWPAPTRPRERNQLVEGATVAWRSADIDGDDHLTVAEARDAIALGHITVDSSLTAIWAQRQATGAPRRA